MIKALLKPVYLYFKQKIKKSQFIKKLNQEPNNLRLVVGASSIYSKGWLGSEEYFLNLLIEKDWQCFFKPATIKMILAEHVWEHLSPENGKIAAAMCFKYLAKGGHLRVAVPDGFNTNEDYINYVKPGGYGAGADDHKVLYNYHTFSDLFKSVGFEIKLLEYFDESGKFNFINWNSEDGHVIRSKRFDKRNTDGTLGYTSLILDVTVV